MPIYEFYCKDCHTIFNFFSSTVNTEKRPTCPKCRKQTLDRQMSSFAVLRGAKEENDMDMPDIDESKLEKAMGMLAKGAENMDEEDPRQAANLMRQLSDMTGLDMGPGMEEALKRMEAGEDPEKIEAEMGDLLEEEPPFELRSKRGARPRRGAPFKDETLYEL
jgi:putative FmdB family regulatory protein